LHIESLHFRLSVELLQYTAFGTDCTQLLQYLGQLSLLPFVAW